MIGDSNRLKEYLRENPKGVFKVIPQDSSHSGGIEIPEGAEVCYFFSGSDLFSREDDFTFYRNGINEIYNGDVDGWLATDPSCYDFILNKGKLVWKRDKLQEAVDIGNVIKPVKSDGGSSSYYFTELPEHLIKDIVKRGGIEIKDIVRYCFDNDADCKDIIKALKRIRENIKGGGKEGVDNIYDANKICFFAEELRSSLKVSINK